MEKKTDQLNLSATPIITKLRFQDFAHRYRRAYQTKASDSQIGAIVLETGMDCCEPELIKKETEQKLR